MLRMVPLPRCGRGGWGSHVPSPCGDVVLKLVVSWFYLIGGIIVSVPLRGCGFEIRKEAKNAAKLLEFPSPCGDVVLKSVHSSRHSPRTAQFPSPCGDVVLKSLPREVLRCAAQSAVLRRGCVSPSFPCGNMFYKQLYPARLYVRRGSPLQYSTEPPAVQAASCAWARLTAAPARRAALSQDNASSHARRCPRGR